MKRRFGLVAGLAIAMVMLVGCTSTEQLGRFTIISSKNADLSRLGEMVRNHEVSATHKKDLNLKIFWFIQTRKVSESYELENALDAVIEQIPGGVALVDAQLSTYESTGFLWFSKRWGYIFEGTVLVDPRVTGENQAKLNEIAPDGNLYAVNIDNTDEVKFVDEKTFNDLVASIK